jgi:hypothetical protein
MLLKDFSKIKEGDIFKIKSFKDNNISVLKIIKFQHHIHRDSNDLLIRHLSANELNYKDERKFKIYTTGLERDYGDFYITEEVENISTDYSVVSIEKSDSEYVGCGYTKKDFPNHYNPLNFKFSVGDILIDKLNRHSAQVLIKNLGTDSKDPCYYLYMFRKGENLKSETSGNVFSISKETIEKEYIVVEKIKLENRLDKALIDFTCKKCQSGQMEPRQNPRNINELGYLCSNYACENFIKISLDQTIEQSDNVNHPNHYGGDTVYETIKVIRAWDMGFNLGNAIKYLSRAGKKDASKEIEDLEKAIFYINDEIKFLKTGGEK